MSSLPKSLLRGLLETLAWISFLIAALSFWAGGRAIHEFAKTDRVLAEFEGLAIAGLFGLFGAALRNAAENFDEADQE
jgi:hypothetical protein